MAAGHRPRRHRHPDGGRAPAGRRGQYRAAATWAARPSSSRIWEWKAKSGGTIVNQLRRLGASCDWSRERFTLDEGLSAAVRKVFVTLHRQKLIYRDKRLVNWDPHFQTAISDLEVEQREVDGHYWHFAYPLEDGSGEIVVATTRPETMLGDTAVAVHPGDERYTALIGKCVRLPIVGRPIPIIADDYADPEKGSGAVKITPAHDFNDFQVGQRHRLPMINVLDPTAPHQRQRSGGISRPGPLRGAQEDRRRYRGAGPAPRRSSRPATPCRTATAPARWSSPI